MTDETKPELVAPKLEVTVERKPNEIVRADEIVDIYKEVMADIRDDRSEIDRAYNNFCDMVFNDGDCSTSSKEALVNLLKMKADAADKKAKVMELLLRAYLKDATPRLDVKAAHAEFNIDNSRRKLLSDLHDYAPDARIKKSNPAHKE